MGVDGISLPFVFLSTVLSVLALGLRGARSRCALASSYTAFLITETA